MPHAPVILLTMDTYVAAKGKVGHVTSSAFRSFSGFISALRNIYEKLIFWRFVTLVSINNHLPINTFQYFRRGLHQRHTTVGNTKKGIVVQNNLFFILRSKCVLWA